MVRRSLEYFLDYFFYKINSKLNLVFGISKSDIQAFKTVNLSYNNYKIIGIFLRSFSSSQIVEYLLTSLKKANINLEERRKTIRINIKETNRCFAFIVEKGNGISCKILDISLGGFRCQLDDISLLQYFTNGKDLKLIHIYIKSYHMIVSGKVVYTVGSQLAIEFTYISDKDKDNLSICLFNLLSENNEFLL
ncbi:MAG TPA: PilZ domain-containing protein [Exilispira sp.]|nr:PilZ domain-containing protein [Exilispira sp.]